MRIIFWGTPEFAANSLKTLIKSNHEILAVVTQPDKKRGRGNKITPSEVKKLATTHNIEVFTPEKINEDEEIKNKIKVIEADIYIVVAFGQLLPKDILDHPPQGCWNCHASILPRWRGAAPIQWSIIKGDKRTGVCFMFMEEGLDTGPILLRKETVIELNDNCYTLENKLCDLTNSILIDSLNLIEQNIDKNSKECNKGLQLTNQNDLEGESTYARQIKKIDYLLNWNNTTKVLHKLIMGLYPNAYTYYKGKRLKIRNSEHPPIGIAETMKINEDNYKCGQIELTEKGIGFFIKTEDRFIFITEAQIEGKKPSRGKSMIQQLGLKSGDFLG